MSNCGKCGANVSEGVKFCSNCGAPVNGLIIPAAGASGTAIESNIAAVLAYVLGFITGIVFLVLEPYKHDSFVRFHAFQSIFVSAVFIVFWIVWNNVFWSLFFAVHFLWPIFSLV